MKMTDDLSPDLLMILCKETVESRFIKELPPISASTAKKKKKSQKATARQLKLF